MGIFQNILTNTCKNSLWKPHKTYVFEGVRRNEIKAREGIDTALAFSVSADSFSRNEIKAREGIDTRSSIS